MYFFAVEGLAGKLSAEEKAELHRAIGYSEGDSPLNLPKQYQDLQLHFLLSNLTLRVTDTLDGGAATDKTLDSRFSNIYERADGGLKTLQMTILKVQVAGLRMDLALRSAANALRFECNLGSFLIDGVGCDDPLQQSLSYRLVDSLEVDSTTDLLEFLYETHPLDACEFDERVVLRARPLQVVFNASTVVRALDLLAPPQTLSVQQCVIRGSQTCSLMHRPH